MEKDRGVFFLIAPELARLAEQAKNMANVSPKIRVHHHHHLAPAVLAREEKGVKQLTATIEFYKSIL